MKRLPFIILLLLAAPAISQSNFSLKELIDLYLSEDSVNAFKYIEAKGYRKARPEETRIVFSSTTVDDQILFSRSNDGSRLGLCFLKNKVSGVTYIDSLKMVRRLLDELRKSGLDLVNYDEPVYEVYTTRKMSYFIWYETTDFVTKNTAMISILPKRKDYEILYNPPKRK